MITQNLHMHSTWDDGDDSIENMILASRTAGLMSVGVSVHCPMPFENDYACPKEHLPDYIAEVRALQAKYAGSIDVYLGVEWDAMAQIDLSPYDYVIGSVHELPINGHMAVDCDAETTARCIETCFAGDADAMAETYFAELLKVAAQPEADIVGHFDLITKFDEPHHFFDENSPCYVRAAERAMDALVAAGKIFEVNTGAISRGCRMTPYPSRKWLERLHEIGGRVTVSADAHSVGGVTRAFDEAEALIRACGFTEIWTLQGKTFVPVRL